MWARASIGLPLQCTRRTQFTLARILISVIHPISLKFLQYIAPDPSWQLIDVSGFTVLFVKKGAFVLPKEIDAREDAWLKKQIDSSLIQSELDKKALGQRGGLAGFITPRPSYIDILEESITLYDLGYKEAGIRRILDSLNIDRSGAAQGALRSMLQRLSP